MATTHLPTVSTAAARPLAALRRHPLIGYFLLAFGLSWLYELIFLLRPGLPFIPALIGPIAAAFIMTAVTDGRAGIGVLLRRFVHWRVGIRWYMFVLVGFPLVYLLGAIVVAGDLPAVSSNLLVRIARSYPYALVYTLVVGGPLLEEPGWRGFALPRLQEAYGPLRGSLILGLLWVAWHLPMYLAPAFADVNGGLSLAGIAVFGLGALAFGLIMTWVFNHTGGSLILAVLLHTTLNAFQGVVNVLYPGQFGSEVNGLIAFGVLALALVIATRGRLGYRDPETRIASATETP